MRANDIPVKMRFIEKVLIEPWPNGHWLWMGTKSNLRYGRMKIDGKRVLAHRASYELWNGSIPEGMKIDHICRNTLCVNPDHLRIATVKQNAENLKGAHRDSSTGIRGVYWYSSKGKYRVRVGHNGKYYHGGYFTDIEEAEQAAKNLRNRLHTYNDKDRV